MANLLKKVDVELNNLPRELAAPINNHSSSLNMDAGTYWNYSLVTDLILRKGWMLRGCSTLV